MCLILNLFCCCRRENNFSFGSDNVPCEPYSPEIQPSPARPKPPKNTSCEFGDIDTSSTCEDIPEVEETSSTAPAPSVDASGDVHSCSNKDIKQENEDQDEERMGLDLKDSFPESGDEHKLVLNRNNNETANTEVLSLPEDFEEHRIRPEELKEPACVMENGIDEANIEGTGVSCKVG